MSKYHLYSDGNYFPKAKKSGFGGYITSPSGEVLVEYTEQIKEKEHSHSFEILGIIRGLEIAKNKGIEHIISHCDDKTTAKKLKEFFEDGVYGIPKNIKPELFQQVIDLSKHFKTLSFEYIPRSLNKYADALSRRYASLMEENFTRQYHQELDFSENKFKHEYKTNKRIFFSHSSIVRNPNKVNPFLVAQVRNKKIRKVSREEQNKPYSYVFNEVFTIEKKTHIRSFLYDEKCQLKFKNETIKDTESFDLNTYINTLSENLSLINEKFGTKHVWIASNFRAANLILEQKEKIPNDIWDSLLTLHKTLNKFENTFFNHLHFDHVYSPEIAPIESKKKKLDEEIYSLEDLMEKLEQSEFVKEKSKYFGEIIRHQLRNYKHILERELDDIEIHEIIQKTVTSLKEKGVEHIPIKSKPSI